MAALLDTDLDFKEQKLSRYFPEPSVKEVEDMHVQERARRKLGIWSVLVFLLAVVLAMSQVGFQVPSGRVIYDGRASPVSYVYCLLLSGDYMVTMQEMRNGITFDTLYMLRPNRHEVSFVASDSVRLSPGLLFLRKFTPATVSLGPGKLGVPRPILCREGDFQFVTVFSHRRVQVFW